MKQIRRDVYHKDGEDELSCGLCFSIILDGDYIYDYNFCSEACAVEAYHFHEIMGEE